MAHAVPEGLLTAGGEVLKRCALLLDPGEVAEVEHPAALLFGEFEVLGSVARLELASEVRRCGHGVVAVGVVVSEILLALAVVELRAIGRHRDDDIVATEAAILGDRDGGECVGDRRVAHVHEHVDERRFEPDPIDEMGLACIGVEQGVERVGRTVADGDDVVGVHHVVDQRHVFVADALDVVIAEAVLQHRRAFERFDCDDAAAVGVLEIVARPEGSG